MAPLLATDRRVLTPDLPGSGLSTRADVSYTLEWQAHIMARWLEAMGLTSVDVVGHSFGGGVAQMLLLECPERLRRIALVASGGLGRDVGFWLRLATFPFMVEHFGQPFMAFGTRRAIGGSRLHGSAADLETLAKMNEQPGTARAFSRAVRSVINFRGQYRMLLQRAHEVDELPPIRVFWGEVDALIPHKHGDALVAATEGVELVTFPGAGHYLHQQQPEAFVEALRAFLDAAELPRATLRPASDVVAVSPMDRIARGLRGRGRGRPGAGRNRET
ncbi:MAG: alpha/beta fold hydrolase [Myxococcales bacterium]|nr:alpha/beta fold hydrolase [Myxococcales bacterium]